MKVLAGVLGALLVLVVLFFGLQIVASESGEVVVLYTDAGGEPSTTRLWVVEDGGFQWLRAGAGERAQWLRIIAVNPVVAVERDGEKREYAAVVEEQATARVNQLMAEKYGWRDSVVNWFSADRDDAIAVRLVPADTPAGASRIPSN